MNIGNLSQEDSLILHKAIESYSAVLGNNKKVSIIIGELERLDDIIDHNLVLNEEGLRVVDHYIVSVFSHQGESLVIVVEDSVRESHMHELRWQL